MKAQLVSSLYLQYIFQGCFPLFINSKSFLITKILHSVNGAVKIRLKQVNEKLKLIDRNTDIPIFVE
jgi:hypothetical protein